MDNASTRSYKIPTIGPLFTVGIQNQETDGTDAFPTIITDHSKFFHFIVLLYYA